MVQALVEKSCSNQHLGFVGEVCLSEKEIWRLLKQVQTERVDEKCEYMKYSKSIIMRWFELKQNEGE